MLLWISKLNSVELLQFIPNERPAQISLLLLLLFGKAWCKKTNKRILCYVNLTEEKTLSSQIMYSRGFMVTSEDMTECFC